MKSLIRDRKGGASVAIAVIMAMIIAVSFVNQILIWGQILNSEDRDRINETLSIESIEFDGLSGKLKILVKNTGSVTAHVVALYIEPTKPAKTPVRYGITDGINFYLDPEDVKDIVPGDLTFSPEVVWTDEFIATVVTERGNSDSETYLYEPSSPIMREVGELGVFRIDWFYSKYSSLQYPPEPIDVDPEDAELEDAVLIYKGDDFVGFYVEIKNVWDRPCKILNDSFLSLNAVQTAPNVNPNFYIVQLISYDVDPGDEPVLVEYNDPFVIMPDEKKLLKFASIVVGSTEWAWEYNYPFGPTTKTEASGITISLFYTVYKKVGPIFVETDQKYGQTISTQAIVLERTGA
jgi:hypothetical protein